MHFIPINVHCLLPELPKSHFRIILCAPPGPAWHRQGRVPVAALRAGGERRHAHRQAEPHSK